MRPNEEHRHSPEEERDIRERALDETIANSFPASDPPSSIPNPDQHDAGVTPITTESQESDAKPEDATDSRNRSTSTR